MSKLTDKASYLKGMADGLKLNPEKDANQLLLAVLDMLSDVAEAIDELDEYVESIDDDLADLEDTLFGDDCDCDDDDCDCCHGHDEDDDELISYACPSCGHELQFNASDVDFDEDYLCPACGKPVFPELDEDEDEE